MKISDYEMLPGCVIDADDPYSLGRVKANVPMLFYVTNEIPVEVLPWIYPLMSFGYQKFSRMEKGAKILVYFNKDNPEEYWYTPMVDMNDRTRNSATSSSSKRGNEVLLCRASGSNAMITYNDEDGIHTNCGENTINMHPTNGIEMKNKTAGVYVAGNNIVLANNEYNIENDSENIQYSLLGENVQKALNEFAHSLGNFAIVNMGGNPYTVSLSDALYQIAENLMNATQPQNFLSSTVKISK